jgi:tetratricopeptide (TPR) repeat protein
MTLRIAPRLRSGVSCAALIVTLLAGAAALAVPTDVLTGSPGGVGLFTTPKVDRRPAQIREIAALAEAGETAAAKQRLAAYLKAHRNDPQGMALAGTMLMAEAKWDEAAVALRQALAGGGDRADTVAKLGVTLLFQGKRPEGARAIDQALALDPDHPLALRYRAWLAEDAGQDAVAIAAYERLVQRQPGAARPTLFEIQLAGLYQRAGRPAALLALLGPHLDREPPALEPDLAAGALVASLGAGDVPRARHVLERTRPILGDDHADVRFAAAALAGAEGDTGGAIAGLTALYEGSTDAGRLRAGLELAGVEARAGRLDAAEALLARLAGEGDAAQRLDVVDAAVRILSAQRAAPRALALVAAQAEAHPGEPDLQLLLARLQAARGDAVGSLLTLERSAEQSPGHALTRYWLAVSLWGLGRQEEARAQARAAVTADPKNVDAWLTLAGMYDVPTDSSGKWVAHNHATDHKPFDDIMAEALAANPEDPRILTEQALMAYTHDRTQAAEAILRRAVTADPFFVPAQVQLASILAQRDGGLAEARELIARAQRIDARDPAVMAGHGWVLARSGDVAAARPILQDAVTRFGTDGLVHYHLAYTLAKLGDVKGAAAYAARARELGLPDSLRVEAGRMERQR